MWTLLLFKALLVHNWHILVPTCSGGRARLGVPLSANLSSSRLLTTQKATSLPYLVHPQVVVASLTSVEDTLQATNEKATANTGPSHCSKSSITSPAQIALLTFRILFTAVNENLISFCNSLTSAHRHDKTVTGSLHWRNHYPLGWCLCQEKILNIFIFRPWKPRLSNSVLDSISFELKAT